MVYLEPAEYAQFGLDEETSVGLITQACAMVESFCRRASLGAESYTERLRVIPGRQGVHISAIPVVSIESVRVRVGRLEPGIGSCLLQDAVAAFGLEGSWSAVDVSTVQWTAAGEMDLPPHALGAAWDEVEVTYAAGWTTVPDAVKCAVAQIVRNAQAMPALNVKRTQMDSMTMEYFSNELMDVEVKRLLLSFVAQRLGA